MAENKPQFDISKPSTSVDSSQKPAFDISKPSTSIDAPKKPAFDMAKPSRSIDLSQNQIAKNAADAIRTESYKPISVDESHMAGMAQGLTGDFGEQLSAHLRAYNDEIKSAISKLISGEIPQKSNSLEIFSKDLNEKADKYLAEVKDYNKKAEDTNPDAFNDGRWQGYALGGKALVDSVINLGEGAGEIQNAAQKGFSLLPTGVQEGAKIAGKFALKYAAPAGGAITGASKGLDMYQRMMDRGK